MNVQIAICMPTLNGARFLEEQLASIVAQRFENWHLYIRDDGSQDGTVQILRGFVAAHPDRATLIEDSLGPLGAKDNFARLMSFATTPYVAFCDQDDIWYPDKLCKTFARLKSLEARHGADIPLMVHTDRRLIGEDGREIVPSYWTSRQVVPSDFGTGTRHFGFCLAAGATMLINRALLLRALPIPPAARMYDTWIELVAHGLGVAEGMTEPTLDHRRHGRNASGAGDDNNSTQARRIWSRAVRLWRTWGLEGRIVARYLAQAEAFRDRYVSELPPVFAASLERFIDLPSKALPGRLVSLARSKTAPPGLARFLRLAIMSGRSRCCQRV